MIERGKIGTDLRLFRGELSVLIGNVESHGRDKGRLLSDVCLESRNVRFDRTELCVDNGDGLLA